MTVLPAGSEVGPKMNLRPVFISVLAACADLSAMAFQSMVVLAMYRPPLIFQAGNHLGITLDLEILPESFRDLGPEPHHEVVLTFQAGKIQQPGKSLDLTFDLLDHL